MAFFWDQVALDALSMSEYEFDTKFLKFEVGPFTVDIVSVKNDLPRMFVVAVANFMREKAIRGFSGCFNARVDTAKDRFWVVMRLLDT